VSFCHAPSLFRRVVSVVRISNGARTFWSCCVLVVGLALILHAPLKSQASAGDSVEREFIIANDLAMAKMMNGMKIKESGDVDRDFTNLMIPHHQGAIDMARAELQYGKNEQLKRIAQEIIVAQQQEIVAMRLAIGDSLPPLLPAPTQPKSGNAHSSLP
jgi:hypothetical protein